MFSGEGILLDGPMERDDFQDQLPGILVESPAWGAPVSLPFEASGTAAAFEAVFQAQLIVDGNVVFDPPFVMSESGVGFAPSRCRWSSPEPIPQRVTAPGQGAATGVLGKTREINWAETFSCNACIVAGEPELEHKSGFFL